MRNEKNNFYVRTDVLTDLKNSIEEKAKACSIEVRLLGGLLKFTPIGVYTKILLELEQRGFKNVPIIYRHRTPELTSMYKGKAVTDLWVIGFLEYNSKEANEHIARKQGKGKLKRAVSFQFGKSVARTPAPLQFGKPVARAPAPRVRCRACDGEGRWREGDPRDGDVRFVACSACRGAGYVPTT